MHDIAWSSAAWDGLPRGRSGPSWPKSPMSSGRVEDEPPRWQQPVQTFTTVSVLNVRSIGMSRITFPVESVTVPRHCSWHSPSEIPRRRQGGGLGSLQILSKTLRGEQVEGVPRVRNETTREMANATHLFRMSLSLGRPYPGQNDHAGADGDGAEA